MQKNTHQNFAPPSLSSQSIKLCAHDCDNDEIILDAKINTQIIYFPIKPTDIFV